MRSLLWYHRDSNQGHTDFQSDALPTELWYHSVSIAGAKVRLFFISQTIFSIFSRLFPKFYAKTGLEAKKSVKHLFIRASCRTFAPLLYRKVAQLVAHYVRDVGVGRSSRLFPTLAEPQSEDWKLSSFGKFLTDAQSAASVGFFNFSFVFSVNRYITPIINPQSSIINSQLSILN